MRLSITDKGVKIDWILIKEEIFQEELYDYRVVAREDEIDNLIMRIGESNRDTSAMKEDLKLLINMDEEYLFSSIDINEYLDSTYWDLYNDHCEAILKLNKELWKKQNTVENKVK